MSQGNSATIERLQCHYLVSKQHPAPEEVRTRLDEVARTYLTEICRRWMEQFLDADNPAIWLIRRVEIDLSVDTGSMDNQELAEIWGRQLALAIVQTIAAAADAGDDTIRHYRNQAVYVAHFVADLADGRAWGKWYYHLFDPVSSLSTSAAMRTVMTREPELITEEVLHLATQRRLEVVLHCLSEHDASLIYELGIPASSDGSINAGNASSLELALSVWASATLELSGKRLATPHNALRLYSAMRERSAKLDTTDARHTIDQLLRIAEVLRNVQQPARLAAHLIADELTDALQLLQGAGMISYLPCLSFLQQVALGDDALVRRVVATVATSVALQEKTSAGMAGRSFTTLLGGIFLLLPSFLTLQLQEFIETVSYVCEGEERLVPALRYLLYLKCFGSLYARWAAIAHDSALLLLAGLEEAPSPETLLRLCQITTDAMNDGYQQKLMERLAHYNHLEGRYLYIELVRRTTGASILLMRDMKHDSWVYASYLPLEAGSIAALWDIIMHGVSLLQKAVAMEPEYLLLGPGCEQLANIETFAIPGKVSLVWTESVQSSAAIPHRQSGVSGSEDEEDILTFWTRTRALPQEIQDMFARYLRCIQPASRDLDYLTLNMQHEGQPPLIANRDLDLAWSLLARALMRAFARRLIGFDRSSIPYLYQNFLAGTSTVYVQQDLVEVRLPCSPLHTILRMAGVNGQGYALPWLNNTQVTLELTC